MTTCSSCGVPGQPDGARFCFSCGAGLQPSTCGNCQAEVVPGSRFCSSCGAELGAPAATAAVPVVARRVTSVLFGDMVGFTALAESRDQEQVRELLSRYFDECRAIIARYGGTVEKFIGDAVMAVWGVPTAHEDDAERAVRAGLELVNTIAAMGSDLGAAGLAMRVGIVTGEVAVTIGATHEGMVAGDAVNTAARVQTAATPGQVWVDETTRLLTSSAITYVDAGSHQLKGKLEPVPLWSVRAVVAAVGGAQRADGLEAPLVGRDREMRLVKELFHGVEETQRPALLIVDGEAGVGKSRLAWEFEKYVDGLSGDVRWHTGRCLSYGEGVAFYALAEAIRARLQILANHGDGVGVDGDDDQAALIAEGLDELGLDPEERAWLEPRVAVLLGSGGVASYPREELFSAWTTFLHRVSETAVGPYGKVPVTLLVDDAQYADDGLLRFLEHLLAVGTFPCFVALLTRPGLVEANPDLVTNRRVTLVHLEPLPAPEMGQLLEGLVAGLDTTVRDALVGRAEGIPLFAVETVRSLIDRDLVVPRGGQYVLAGSGPLDLDAIGAPASLQALVAARLDKLTAEQRRVLDRASIVGRSFDRDAIAALVPDVADVDEVLASLVRLQMLRRESNRFSTELGMYQFVQAVVQQVAYGTLSRRDRKAGHLAVVALFGDGGPAEDVSAIAAQHYLEAIDAVPEDADVPELTASAIAQLRRAAARANGLGAPAEAAGHLRSALDRADEPELRARLELDLAQALKATGDMEGSLQHAGLARVAFDALGDESNAGLAVTVEAYATGIGMSDFETGIAAARERYERLRGRDDTDRAVLELNKVLVQLLLRSGGDFRDLVDEKARIAELVEDDGEIADSHVGLALHHMLTGSREAGRALFESAASIARRIGRTDLLSRSLANLNVTWTPDDAARAVGVGVDALAASRQSGALHLHSNAAVNLAMAEYFLGDWDSALSHAAEGASDREIVDLVEGQVARARGEQWQPTPELQQSDGGGDESLRAFLDLARALATDAGPDAPAVARAAADLMYDATGLYDDYTFVWWLASEVALEAGAVDELAAMCQRVDDHRDGRITIGLKARRAHVAGVLAVRAGDADEAERQLRTAVETGLRWGSEPTVARCRADLAVLLAGQGRADEARVLAEEARASYDRLGAVVWSRRLDEALAPASVQ
ncbi:adenylate/guanylate cyclase domain-containing protein [Nocardioides mangrovi]|uniref:AAA family ATPase n=1 Tax=Nocardioides mangrovi TaxID=2874580 RepID=A0ABS7U6Z0_9ACTN|nr:adenylate/guanylate cyclase domain-containing protein [Nocardioides mangrovi]MBZ5736714.1 AAA family ATPase [Nocardioides mangrovi]